MFAEGYTYAHEHIRNSKDRMKVTDDVIVDVTQAHLDELRELYKKGVRNIFEVTTKGSGDDPRYTMDIAKETGINIVLSTGFYKEPLLPEYFYKMSEGDIVELFVKEITVGINDTEYKAGIIGEVGSGRDIITEAERRLLAAAAKASVETGNTPIYTHASYGTMGLEQIEILSGNGAMLNRVIIGHQDVSYNPQYTLNLLGRGVYIGIDTIGKQNYITDEQRLSIVLKCLDAGYEDKIVLSMDISRQHNMKFKGGIGYSYLLDVFLPMLEDNGVSKAVINKLMVTNPKTWLLGS
ncbi:MAG: phosphotriesterase-related protein [Defluviitaleaceae bacterium]|nr:phosphotriesterase-related protein [Defluviitaleaceae bacterium]